MIVLQYLLAILGLSLIIIVHEFGHFLFARFGGMHVIEFYMGFGPKIFSHKARDGTTYGVRAVPVGGYIKVLGMDRNEIVPDDMKDRSFHSKSFLKKFLVIISGAGLNVFLALVLVWIFLGMGVFSPTNIIDYIQPGAPAETYGFKVGDRVVSLDGNKIESWEDFAEETQKYPEKKVTYIVVRDTKEIKIEVKLDNVEGRGYLGVSPKYVKENLGFVKLIGEGFRLIGEISVTYIKLFGMLFSGKLPFNEARPVSPVGVVSMFQQSAALGMQNFILFVGIVSILMGFGNLLPLMPLDGGNMVLLIIESIRKKPIPRKALNIFNSVGIFILMSILIIGFVFDIISPFNLTNM